MAKILDRYNWQARVCPVYLTILPVIPALWVVLPQGLDPLFGAGTAIVFAPLAYLAGQIGAFFGKRLEKGLWQKWNGPPTTRYLRHLNTEFNEIRREQLHTTLRRLGCNVPSEYYQQDNSEAADVHWEACTQELIGRTRDSEKFPLVFKGLTEYGFHRNMLGLKRIGLLLSILALLICSWNVYDGWTNQEDIAVAITMIFLSFLFCIIWIVWVKESAVAIAADRYARFLFEAAQQLE